VPPAIRHGRPLPSEEAEFNSSHYAAAIITFIFQADSPQIHIDEVLIRRLALRFQAALPVTEFCQRCLQAIKFRGQFAICLVRTW
jgi:uncharacterized metal-binding protein YceD (DUF177 family)